MKAFLRLFALVLFRVCQRKREKMFCRRKACIMASFVIASRRVIRIPRFRVQFWKFTKRKLFSVLKLSKFPARKKKIKNNKDFRPSRKVWESWSETRIPARAFKVFGQNWKFSGALRLLRNQQQLIAFVGLN